MNDRHAIRMLFRLLSALVAVLSLGTFARADCVGQDLIAALPADRQAAIEAAVQDHPFAQGNLWRATRGDQVVHLVGSYHFGDPRHAATMTRIRPLMDQAATILVEAGPEEERALLRDMAERPELLFLTEGPSLMQRMDPAEWASLTEAMAARGIPAFMAAKFRPWYLAMMLAVPPCDASAMMDRNGLDQMVIDHAQERGIPLAALEPHDTIFALFDTLSIEDQISMIHSSLAFEAKGLADSLSVTLADLYFAQDSRRMWEFMRLESHDLPGYTPETADAEFARMEQVLMSRRNQAWIPVIEAAAAKGPVFAAFGALHLAGTEGVLNLLQQQGWHLERLEL
jgi:uncharacterized protein YbaP (TraB family)